MKKCIVVMLVLTAMFSLGFIEMTQADSNPTLIFSDDFEMNDFDEKWISGTAGEPDTIDIVNGRVRSLSNCNFIETKQSFTGNLQVEVEIEKDGDSDYGCFDFYIELPTNGATGVIRFDHNEIDAINIGNNGFGICGDENYSIDGSGSNKGTIILSYLDSYVDFSFTNEEGTILSTGKLYAGAFDSTKIRIWFGAHSDTPRYADNVKVYSLDSEYESEFSSGYDAGRQACIEDPASCGISVSGDYTQSDLDAEYQSGYNAGLSECSDENITPATLSNGLDMHIPMLQLGTMNLWADFEFAGESNGDLIWKLSDYGQESK